MASIKVLVLGYLCVTHVLLQCTSPSYRHEVSRALRAIKAVPAAWSQQLSVLLGQESLVGDPGLPQTGVYASTDLLHSIQAHMTLQGSKLENGTQATAVYSSSHDLIAYMSATDVVYGEGWKARAAFFLFLLAPRFILASPGGKFLPEFNLLYLASCDLPAVGSLNRSEDPSVGYQLSCTSPALSMGLGPQPLARCTVWLTDTAAVGASQHRRRHIPRGNAAAAAARARLQADAAAAANSSSSSSDSDDGRSSSINTAETCSADEVVATWTVLPDSTPEGVAQQLKDIGAEHQPYLAGNRFKRDDGWLSSFLDIWLFFPRAFLLQVVPAMAGLQQLLYAAAVLAFSYQDLVQLVGLLQRLQAQAMHRAPFWGMGGWGFVMVGLSIVAQLLLITAVKAAFAGLTAYAAVHVLLLLARGVHVAAGVTQGPFLSVVGSLLDVTGTAKAAAAAVLTLLAVIRLYDVAAVLSSVIAFVLITGIVFDFLDTHTDVEEQTAAVISVFLATSVCIGFDYAYYTYMWPAMVLPPGAASSRSWLVRLAARASAAAKSHNNSSGATAAAAAATTAAAVSAAAASSHSSGRGAAMHATAAAVRGMLLPWQGHLLLVHSLCEDCVMLTVAFLVWEALIPLSESVWHCCQGLLADISIVLDCFSNCLEMVIAGISWRVARTRFLAQAQARLQQQHAGPRNADAGMQAQLVIHAQQAVFANVNHTADALRALADELENVDADAHRRQLLAGGRWLMPRMLPTLPRLGEHWPAALQVNFDIDDMRDELGFDVPRGFICPLTMDIMKQPALLISSNIAVPSSYEKEAITRWLVGSRRDPKSRRTLAPDAKLVPNFDLYRAIDDWVAHTQTLLNKHRQQQEQQQAAEATAAAAAAAGGSGPGLPPSTAAAAAAAAGPSSAATARGTRAVSAGAAAAAAVAASGPQPSSSAGTISSLLAAARGAVVRGTAAAAAAAAAGTARPGRRRRPPPRRRQQGAAAAAAAAGGDGDGEQLSEVDEEEGGAAADAAGSEGGGLNGSEYDPQEHLLSEDAEDLDAVHSHPGHHTAAAAAAAGRGSPEAAQGELGAQAAAGGGRYNLRMRRSASGSGA